MLACALSWARAGERVNRGETGRGESGARPRPARYIERMQYVLPALVVIAMLATLGTLFLGIISMAKGGNPQRSNKLMTRLSQTGSTTRCPSLIRRSASA